VRKITIGIKENDKVIFLRTEEVSDEFNTQKLIRAIKTVVDIFMKREGSYHEQTHNEFDSDKET